MPLWKQIGGPDLAKRLAPLRVVVIIGGIGAILYWARGHGAGLSPKGSILQLALALLANQVAIGLLALRFHTCMRLFGIPLSAWQSARICLQGIFYMFFIPVSIGNEVSRYIKIRQVAPETPPAPLLAGLLVDRVAGLIGFLVIAGALALHQPRFARMPAMLDGHMTAFAAVTGIAVAAFCSLLFIPRIRHVLRSTIAAMRSHADWAVANAALSVLVPIAFTVAIHTSCRWVGFDLPWDALAFAIAVSSIGQIIPISIGGLGATEVGTSLILIALGTPEASAMVAGSICYLARLMVAVEGGVWELASRDGRRAAAAAMRDS